MDRDETIIPPPAPGAPYHCQTCGGVIGHTIVRNGASLLVLPGGAQVWRASGYCTCGGAFWFASKSPAMTKITKRKR